MSVQVRRRRESASFLSSYVGAQGELLVDTTSNRLQVHDGATPGGWPAARIADLSGRNVALNGTFAINQRGYASGTALAAGAYAHDRWKAGSGGCTYTFAQTVPDTQITITAGSLIQAVDAPNVYATAWWLTWMGSATARVWQGSASGSFSAGTQTVVGGVTLNALPLGGLTAGTVANIEFSSGTLGLVQLEAALPNAGPTRFERRHGEMAVCQRYFLSIVGPLGYEIQYSVNAAGSGQNYLSNLTFPVTMRSTPTVAKLGTWNTTNCSFGLANPTSSTVLLVGTSAGPGFLSFSNTAGAGFTATAEL